MPCFPGAQWQCMPFMALESSDLNFTANRLKSVDNLFMWHKGFSTRHASFPLMLCISVVLTMQRSMCSSTQAKLQAFQASWTGSVMWCVHWKRTVLIKCTWQRVVTKEGHSQVTKRETTVMCPRMIDASGVVQRREGITALLAGDAPQVSLFSGKQIMRS